MAFHFPGPPGRFIDVFEGDGRYALAETSSVTVLGQQGRMGAIHEGYKAEFAGVGPASCTRYSIEAFGVALDDFRRFLEGLRSA